MKVKLNYIILTIVTGLLLSSCANKLSLMKRKYTKGYYVSHSHKAGAPKEQAVAFLKEKNAISELKLKTSSEAPELKRTRDNEGRILVLNDNSTKTSLAENKTVLIEKKKYVALTQFTFKSLEKIAPKPLHKKIAMRDPNAGLVAATLSLFWIVLVIILILYLLGIVFDGFGVGNLIHLLAVIFLVLLILWLLKIV